MDMVRWIIGGSIGGAIGAAIWAAVAYFTNFEVGWIAWLIGVAVGVGVQKSGSATGSLPGVVAVVIAALAIAAGKYAAISLAIGDIQMAAPDSIPPGQMIAELAHETCAERQARGQAVKWPDGVDPEEASEAKDFPPDVWQEASKKWEALGPAEQQRQMAERHAEIRRLAESFAGEIRKQAFLSSFSGFDILWFFLAAGSAFKLGSGATNE